MDKTESRSSRPKSRQSLAHIPSRSQQMTSDRGNLTTDLSTLADAKISKSGKSSKRTRGKSLGPGGLEALNETTGNVTKAIKSFQPKSILKPTVPLTPPKNIPSFDELHKKHNGNAKSPARNTAEDLLIDFSTPAPPSDSAVYISENVAQTIPDPFSPTKSVATNGVLGNSKSEDDVAEMQRQADKKAILEKKAARRKSMANRRVSFAPEATLHTWSVMELQEDSTTSSAANSTRRQSSLASAQSPARILESGPAEPPSTPPEQVEEPEVRASPAQQRDLHQKKRRRTSSMSTDMDISGDEVYSSSPSGDLTTHSSPMHVEDSMDSESDSDGDTAMSMDDTTSHTMQSQDSSTQSSLDARLRQAAHQAGTRGIEYDEHGDDLSMEIADGTVTSAFQPWVKNNRGNDSIANEDQENINPFHSHHPQDDIEDDGAEEETQGMTMDMTKAVGGIVSNNDRTISGRKAAGNRRRSSVARRKSSGADTSYGDETMDFTVMGGGIVSGYGENDPDLFGKDDASDDNDETMEFTKAVGSIKPQHRVLSSTISPTSEGNDTMDMTMAVGGILDPIEEQTEPQTDYEDDRTAAMEMTRAVGHILAKASVPDSTSMKSAPEEVLTTSTSPATSPPNAANISTHHMTSIASETGSPSLALKPRLSARSRSTNASHSTTPKSTVKDKTTPSQLRNAMTSTPEKQLTPVPRKADTPDKTPLGKHVRQRGPSPKKLFQAEIKLKSSPLSARKPPSHHGDPLFAKDVDTGQQTPRYVLHAPKPHQHLRRRSSGIGIDKEGFGSPRISELLDRRTSIGDAAPEFKVEPNQKGRIRFEDPKQIEQEIDAQRAEDERRESGRFIMEQEADEHQEENATLQLKDLIESMTPKKNNSVRLRGRKSLAVGSARGLLGKRPAELDENDEADEDGDHTPKRLKTVSRDGSPVKAIHLPKPPSKEETTGRLSRTQQLALEMQSGLETPQNSLSPKRNNFNASPQAVGRFKDLQADGRQSGSFEERLDNVVGAVDPSLMNPIDAGKSDDKISLQQFLNMTNVHFIELSTTKRRHTMPPNRSKDVHQDDTEITCDLASAFVAAATTLPLLELYQHATRELKTYISSGRKIIRSIENETLAEQPPLFREYMEARPDVKLVMDNQFRNGKTSARLQSKEGWYTWRSQLVDGLQAGLEGIRSDMDQDTKVLSKQQSILDTVVPTLSQKHSELGIELASLQAKLVEMESIDQEELKARRHELQIADQSFAEKSALLSTLQEQMNDKEEALCQAAELKDEMHAQIVEANRYREEHRGWPVKDVVALKSKVDSIQQSTGWMLLNAEEVAEAPDGSGLVLSMVYKDELKLVFSPFGIDGSTAQRRRSSRGPKSRSSEHMFINLSYCKAGKDENLATLPAEKRFFYQSLQTQLNAYSMMPKGNVPTKQILNTISVAWDMATKVSEEIRMLNIVGLTKVAIRSAEELTIRLVLLMDAKSRVDVEFVLNISDMHAGELTKAITVNVSPVYGTVTTLLDPVRARKVQNALGKEIEAQDLGEGALISAIEGFEKWYQAQSAATKASHPAAVGSKKETKDVTLQHQDTEDISTPRKRIPQVKRSPLAAKKVSAIQKKALPVPVAATRQLIKPARDPIVDEKQQEKDKENAQPEGLILEKTSHMPAITPEMQEAMMQHTPIKRVGALRRSPIGGNGY